MIDRVACRSCGSAETMVVGRGARGRSFAGVALAPAYDGGWFYRCANCHLLMRHPVLTATQYAKLYALTSGDHWTKADLRAEQVRISEYIRASLPNGGTVLDVGCSSGDLLNSLGSDFSKFGVEPAAEARVRAQRLGITVICDSVEELNASHLKFDVITAVDVIEHVSDPLAFLLRLADHLREGGRIIVSTGNADAFAWRVCGLSYYYSHLFEHISFISERWCNYLVGKGFQVDVLQARFPHQGAEPLAGLSAARKYALLCVKFVPAWLERYVLARLPTSARKLGPRLMLAEPGMFNDHILAVFAPTRMPCAAREITARTAAGGLAVVGRRV